MSETVTVVLGGDPTLGDLRVAVDALFALLEGLAVEAEATEIRWDVDGLEKSSAGMTFRGVGVRGEVQRVADLYLRTAGQLRDHKPVASRVAKAARQFLEILDERVSEIRFETADDDVTIVSADVGVPTPSVEVPRPGAARGAVEGRVQTLSSRGSLRFTLYDLRHDKAVGCYLRQGDEAMMRDACGRIAVVEGTVKRDGATGRPLTIRNVTRIEFTDEGHKGDWRQAEGALRGVGSDEPAEVVIRRLRDAR